MEKRIALLFPGQGSQYVGMGKDLWDHFVQAREVFGEASDTLQEDVARLCFEGPEDRLRLTAHTQPAILTVSVAAWRVLRSESDLRAFCAAGHSLGEYSALVAAGALAFKDAVAIVRRRGQLMQEAVPADQGAMAAVLGLDSGVVETLCSQYEGPGVVAAANLNGPGQVVISGDAAAVERVCQSAAEKGARKVIPLPVSAPFHSPLMAPACERLRAVLEEVQLGELSFDVISNVEAAPYPSVEAVVELLTRQVSMPVLWQASMERMAGMGVTYALELGPRKVLSGLMKRIAPEVKTGQVEDHGSLQAVLQDLTKG